MDRGTRRHPGREGWACGWFSPRDVISVRATLALLVLAGCTATPPVEPPREPAAEQAEDSVEIALRRAESASVDRIKASHYFDALLGLHARGDSAGAARVVARLRALGDEGKPLLTALPEAARRRFQTIALGIAVDNPDQAVGELLAVIDPAGRQQEWMAARLRARELGAAGLYAEAARILISLATDPIEDETQLADVSAAIWRYLSSMAVPELARNAAAATAPEARAWWSLAHDFNGALTGTEQRSRWQRWRASHPRHVATRFPPQELSGIAPDPSTIALLSPLGGDFGVAGEAVRDGFVAAYLHARASAPAGAEVQGIHIYDTAALSVEVAYEQARRQGVDVVVGPLTKSALTALAATAPDLPVIALNSLDNGGREGIIQLSLAVEDEARAIASALAAEGFQRVVLFDSPARWASRARTQLEASLGGIEIVEFGTLLRVEDITSIVGDALHVTESQVRAGQLEQDLGATFEFTPRRRDDVDAVVALVDSAELKSLKPALDFHFARDLPVYAPSPAIDTTDLGRLEGVRVCDIPWRIHGDELSDAVRAAFPLSRGSYAALFALGVDGYRLANQLPRVQRRTPIVGSTGTLLLGDDGRIRRELAWAEVQQGTLVPIPAHGRARAASSTRQGE